MASWGVVLVVICTFFAGAFSPCFAQSTNSSKEFRGATNLPLVVVKLESPLNGDQKIPATLEIISTNQGKRLLKEPALVRHRGATSRSYPKQSLAITFETRKTLLGLRESQHWILNAAFIDRSLMRHKLSYDLFRAMSSPGQPRYAVASRFVEAILNDQYVGVYLLMERIDRDLLKLARFSSNNTEHAVIYKAVDHSANFSQPGHAGFEQQEPDPLALSYWKPLQDLNQFISTAPAEEFFDPTSGIASRVDLQNAIDFHLLVLLTSNHDGITKNFILARDRTEGAKFFFVPWDYDGTFGRNWNAQKLPADSWLSNHLFDRLFSNPKIQESYRSRWLELRRGPFATARIQEMIEENARSIRLGMERNQRRWQSASGWYPDSLTFEEDIREMKEWVAARGAFLDERFKEKPR